MIDTDALIRAEFAAVKTPSGTRQALEALIRSGERRCVELGALGEFKAVHELAQFIGKVEAILK